MRINTKRRRIIKNRGEKREKERKKKK